MKKSWVILWLAIVLMIAMFLAGAASQAKIEAAPARAAVACAYMDFASYQALPYNRDTSGEALFMATVDNVYPTTIAWVTQAFSVQGTNNTSNHWNFHYKRLDTQADLFGLSSCDPRSGCAPSYVWSIAAQGPNVSLSSSMKGVYVLIEKVGSPGNLHMASPAVCLQ